MRTHALPFLVLLVGVSFATPRAQAMQAREVKPVPMEFLSDHAVSRLGRKALAIRSREWLHGESDHFIYHFFDPPVVNQATIEAEYYYRFIASELRKETAQWQRKCHLFLFDRGEDWRAFQGEAALDPWTGGIHAGGELFVFRDRTVKWKGHTLGHEIAHLILFRFFGNGIPLWFNEGYSEDVSVRAFALYFKARGYASKPWSNAVNPAEYIPLSELVSAVSYPPDKASVQAFYCQSQRLVRFLDKAGRDKFLRFMDSLAGGARFDTALREGFSSQFDKAEVLESQFRPYASEGFENVVSR